MMLNLQLKTMKIIKSYVYEDINKADSVISLYVILPWLFGCSFVIIFQSSMIDLSKLYINIPSS